MNLTLLVDREMIQNAPRLCGIRLLERETLGAGFDCRYFSELAPANPPSRTAP